MHLNREEVLLVLIDLIKLKIEELEFIFKENEFNEIYYKDIYILKQYLYEVESMYYKEPKELEFKRIEEIRKNTIKFGLKLGKYDILEEN